jgi:hypothetical protein
MKNMGYIFLFFIFIFDVYGKDTIITKQNNKYEGTVVNRTEKGFELRRYDGSMIVIPSESISQIIRGNIVYDLDEGMKYQTDVRHPFLPFAVLGVVTGAYAVKSFKDYQNERDKMLGETPPDYQNTSDKSKTFLAYSVVSALFSAGSFYIAFKPMEFRIPMTPISLSTTSTGLSVAMHF